MIAEKYEDTTYGEDAMSSIRDYLHRGSDQVSNIVDDRPGTSVMMACLIGFGVGLLVSQVFSSDERAYSNTFDHRSAERFGRNLLERLEHALPSAIRERLTR